MKNLNLSILMLSSLSIVMAISCNTTKQTDTHTDMNAELVEKYWKLIEIDGKKIEPSDQRRKEPHIIFKAAANRVNGNGGCNGFSGSYTLEENNRLVISQVMATKMACENMEIEDQMFRALNAVRAYTVQGDTLLLKDESETILARFEVVYLR